MNKIITSLLGVTAGVMLLTSIEYADIPDFSGKTPGTGRTKNSISAVVAGIVGKNLYGNSEIELKIKKHFWPDAKLTGGTTKDSIDTYVDLSLTSAKFKAVTNKNGYLEGKVDKSEFDWEVKQTGYNTYKIKRLGPKFNAELELNAANGIIEGIYRRSGPHFNWDIKGTYDNVGNVEIEIDGPLSLGITLKGKIDKK